MPTGVVHVRRHPHFAYRLGVCALAVCLLLCIATASTVATDAITEGDRELPDEATAGDTVTVTTTVDRGTPDGVNIMETFADGIADTEVTDDGGGDIQAETTDRVEVAFTGSATASITYELTIDATHGDPDGTTPIAIDSESHPDTVGSDSIIIVREGDLSVSVPPGGEFSNIATGIDDTPPRIIVPDDIDVSTTVSNPTDGESSAEVGLAVFPEDEISLDDPPRVHAGETASALTDTTESVSLAADETTTVETTASFAESDTGEYVVVASTGDDTSTSQVTAGETVGFEDTDQWQNAYDRELEWVPPRLPGSLPIEPSEYYQFWNGIPTQPGTIEDQLQDTGQVDTLVRSAAYYDFYNTGPPETPSIWNTHTHTTYPFSPGDFSFYPTTAETTDSNKNLGEGRSLINDAFIKIAAVSPSTYWHTDAEEDPTHLVRNNASLLVGADYRVEEPGESEYRSDHRRSSSALDVRFSVQSRSFNTAPLTIKADGIDVTNRTVSGNDARGGSEITYGTLVNEPEVDGAGPVNLSVSTEYSYSKDVDVDELVCVETDEEGNCVSTEWQDAGELNYRDEQSVENNTDVTVLDAHPDRRALTETIVEEAHDRGTGQLDEGEKVQYEYDPEAFWAGVEILTESPTAENTIAKGSHYFYTKRNKDWDIHVQANAQAALEYTSQFTPLELHAYPIEDGPHITRGEGTIITAETSDTKAPPQPPSGVNASTGTFENQGNSSLSPAMPFVETETIVVQESAERTQGVRHLPAVPTLDRDPVVNTTDPVTPPALDVVATEHEETGNTTLDIELTDPETGAALPGRQLAFSTTPRTVQTDTNGEASIELLPGEQGTAIDVVFDSQDTDHATDSAETYASTTQTVQLTGLEDLDGSAFLAELFAFIETLLPWMALVAIIVATAKAIAGAG